MPRLGVVALALVRAAGPRRILDLVTTYGTSMEPTLHAGDLVVVRPQDDYRVGDVVAYRSEQLGTIVLHRIIAREGDRYVFKGDNNSWIDEERPTADDLIGAMDTHFDGHRCRGSSSCARRWGSAPSSASASSRPPRPRRSRRRRDGQDAGAASGPMPRRDPRCARSTAALLVAAGAVASC